MYRDAILAAAEAEFSTRGYAATKMVDVARRAGLSVGALYRYFENKEAIFCSLIERGAADVIARMEKAGEPADPRDRLAALIRVNLAFIEENRPMFLAFHTLGDTDRASCRALVEESDSVRCRVSELYRKALADGVAAGAFRDDIPVDDQLAFLTGTIHGFIEAWITGDGAGGLAEKSALISRLTLRALGGTS
jgi:TetR/AcrR family transcriptional regulator